MAHVRLNLEMRDRLFHHSRRVGRAMTDLILEGTIAHIERLDEKELVAFQVKKARAQPGDVSLEKRPKAKGLGLRKREAFKPIENQPVRIPEKIERSFRRWAEFIEDAAGTADREIRAQTVVSDIRQRTTSEADANAAYTEFKKFLRTRAEERRPQVDVVTIGEIPIGGDLPEA